MIIRVSNGLDPDQDRRYVSPDLGSNCLQKLSAVNRMLARKELRSYQCQDYKFKGLNAVFKAKSSIIIYLLFTLRGQTDCLGKTQSVPFIHSCFEKVFEFQFIHIFALCLLIVCWLSFQTVWIQIRTNVFAKLFDTLTIFLKGKLFSLFPNQNICCWYSKVRRFFWAPKTHVLIYW